MKLQKKKGPGVRPNSPEPVDCFVSIGSLFLLKPNHINSPKPCFSPIFRSNIFLGKSAKNGPGYDIWIQIAQIRRQGSCSKIYRSNFPTKTNSNQNVQILTELLLDNENQNKNLLRSKRRVSNRGLYFSAISAAILVLVEKNDRMRYKKFRLDELCRPNSAYDVTVTYLRFVPANNLRRGIDVHGKAVSAHALTLPQLHDPTSQCWTTA